MSLGKNPHAVALGRMGGAVRSEAKAAASRENGRKGGRPKGSKNKTTAKRKRRKRPIPAESVA